MILSSSLGLRLNSDKGTKTLTGFFGTFCAGRTFGDSAAPKIDACLVHQFWRLNTDRILQALLRRVVHSPSAPLAPRGSTGVSRLSAWSAANEYLTMPESRPVRVLVPLLELT